MLDFKKDRLDYGRIISPPSGFVFDRAVATTYSLDMTALLAIPIALVYAKNLDDRENWMNLFDSLQKTSNAIKVYCQMSKIKDPINSNKFFSFIDESFYQVLPESPGVSFHPKIWVLRFKGPEKQILYRLIILSRNLTFDRSWDIVFYLEGFVDKTIQSKNKSLVDYIKHLSERSDFLESRKFINDLSGLAPY